MAPKGSLPLSKTHATCPYSESDQSNLCPHPTNWISILILFSSLTPRSSKWSPLGFPTKTLYPAPAHLILPYLITLIILGGRFQWPRGLRRRSAAARLLRLWVLIPAGAWMSVVSVVCCQIEVSATSWSLIQRSPADCGTSLCVI
jgi:hypothetical protein